MRSAVHQEIVQQRAVHEMRREAGYEEDPRKTDGSFFSMHMLDVGDVSREVQLAVDLIVQYHGFSGSTSLVAAVYHAIEEDWEIFAFAAAWGLFSLAICIAAIRRVDWAERLLTWSMIAVLIESNMGVMIGIAPEGFMAVSMWAVVVSCLVHPTKGNIILMHMIALLCSLNYYLGKSTGRITDFAKNANNTVNLVWRAAVACWGILILAVLMVNVLKPIRRRIQVRRRTMRLKLAEEKARRDLERGSAESESNVKEPKTSFASKLLGTMSVGPKSKEATKKTKQTKGSKSESPVVN